MSIMYLDNIPMSGRTRRCLKRLGCRTVEDVNNLDSDRINRCYGLGKITLKEINKILEENGFSSKYI